MILQTLKGFNRDRLFTLKIIEADPLIKLKKYSDTFTKLGSSIDGNGRPVTGLSEARRDGGKVVSPGTRMVMERELDMTEGALKQMAAFWVSYFIPVGSEDIILDLQDPHHLLQYLFACAQSNVAEGIKEIETNSKAEFVIFSEEDQARIKVEAKSALKQAYILSDKLDMETKINLCTVYGHMVQATEPNTIEAKITEALEENPEKFLKLANDDNLVSRSLIGKALDQGILELDGGAIMHGEIPLGYDKDEAARNLAKDHQLQIVLKAKLTGDMSAIREALSKEQ